MNFAVVLFALVAVVSAESLKDEVIAQGKLCAAKFGITDEVFKQFATKLADVEVTENIKCFSKCITDEAKLISKDDVFDVEKLVKIWVALGRAETQIRSDYEKCKTLFKSDSTCDQAWAAYTCVRKF